MRRAALIIAGGSGERFWPLSTPTRPKQLLKLTDSGRVMLHEAVDRVSGIFDQDHIFVVTAPHLAESITQEIPFLAGRVFAEPEKKNTAGAVAWGMGTIAKSMGTADISFAILPSDHVIRPPEAFRSKVLQALETSEQLRKLVTIGIVPDRPETGYGYIHRGGALDAKSFSVIEFTEKPDLDTARSFLEAGGYLWNSGMFFWRMDTFLEEIASAWPDGKAAYDKIVRSLEAGGAEEARQLFGTLPNLSIDHALLEKSSQVAVLESTFQWDDLGSWDALSRAFGQDGHGNVRIGKSQLLEAADCIVHNSNPSQVVSLLGVKDLVVVVTEDAVMVLPKNRAQDVRKLASMRLDAEI